MKLGTVFGVVSALMIGGPALAQKVYVDYDPDYQKKPKTFAWPCCAASGTTCRSGT